jgi:hypothetical protein
MSRNPFAFTRSPSQLRNWFACPRKWFLSYAPGQRWRSKVKASALIQGSVYHKVVELLMKQGAMGPVDPLEYFWWLWEGVGAQLEKDEKISYGDRDSWGRMGQRGRKFWGLYSEPILEMFGHAVPVEHQPRLGAGIPLRLVEHDIRYNQGVPSRAIIDYAGPLWVRDLGGGQFADLLDQDVGGTPRLLRALIDFKTVKYTKEQTAAELDAQLMSQQLAIQSVGATVDVVGLCSFVVQQEKPRLQWLLRKPYDAHELGLFLSDAIYADQEIMSGHFPMAGRWTGECEKFGGCEYRALCFRSRKDEAGNLYKDPHPQDADDLGITLEEWD